MRPYTNFICDDRLFTIIELYRICINVGCSVAGNNNCIITDSPAEKINDIGEPVTCLL